MKDKLLKIKKNKIKSVNLEKENIIRAKTIKETDNLTDIAPMKKVHKDLFDK